MVNNKHALEALAVMFDDRPGAFTGLAGSHMNRQEFDETLSHLPAELHGFLASAVWITPFSPLSGGFQYELNEDGEGSVVRVGRTSLQVLGLDICLSSDITGLTLGTLDHENDRQALAEALLGPLRTGGPIAEFLLSGDIALDWYGLFACSETASHHLTVRLPDGRFRRVGADNSVLVLEPEYQAARDALEVMRLARVNGWPPISISGFPVPLLSGLVPARRRSRALVAWGGSDYFVHQPFGAHRTFRVDRSVAEVVEAIVCGNLELSALPDNRAQSVRDMLPDLDAE